MAIVPVLDIDEIITHIYHGPLEHQPWQTFLRQLRERLGCDTAAIMLRPARLGVASLTFWDSVFVPDAATLALAGIEHAQVGYLDPLTNALSWVGDVRTIDDVIARPELLESTFYQTLMQPYGIEYMLGMCFAAADGWRCFVGIINGPAHVNFGAEEKDFLRALCPHLGRALQTYAALRRSELEKQVYEDALDRLTIGTLILDGRGKVISSNAAARNIIEHSTSMALVDDFITLAKSKYATTLNQLLKTALDWFEKQQLETFVDVLQIESPGEPRLGVLVRTVLDAQGYQSDASPAVIVYLSDLEQHQQIPEQFIGRLFGLTPAEALLATLLADGLTLTDAAARLNLTEGSVRTCSKRIYAKTGVNRQAGLVRLILKSVALLAGGNELKVSLEE